ncbi:MAG TPA: YraN family protein [Bdellovibrionota bacterium]|nr:YraN family protein [Bdellovibrionota bacterium]
MPRDPRQEFGRRAEKEAANYLRKKGHRILERNYRTPLGEIDLITEWNKTIVFVEVKAGKYSADFSPVEHLDSRKRNKLLLLGEAYLSAFSEEKNARFDLVSITENEGGLRVDHFEDVIQDAFL